MRSGALRYVQSKPSKTTLKVRTTKISAAARDAAKRARQQALFDAAMNK